MTILYAIPLLLLLAVACLLLGGKQSDRKAQVRSRLSRWLHLMFGRTSAAPYQRMQAVESEAVKVLQKFPPSPLTTVPFASALQSQELGLALKEYCASSLTNLLSGDGANIAIQTLLLSSNELTLVYKFSREATALYEAGKLTIPLHRESGRLLPWMMDKDGMVFEQAKSASMMAARLASVWAVVVSTAHIISGLDVLKRLENIDKKMDILVSGRAIDQEAQLARIYIESASILRHPLTVEAVRRLVQFRYDLFQLRHTWRGEIASLVKAAVLPDKPVLYPSSWWRRGSREKKVVDPLVACADKLRNLRLAMMTDVCLAYASGTAADLLVNAVPTERDFWAPLNREMRQLEGRFRHKNGKVPMETLRGAVEGYSELLNGIQGATAVQSSTPHLLLQS